MTDRELMQQALEALQSSVPPTYDGFLSHCKAMNHIRIRLAQPEQEPESFEQWNAKQHGDPEEIGFLQALRVAYCAGQDSMTAGLTRLAQPEQEPLQFKCTVIDDAHPNGVPLEQWGKQPEQEPVTLPCCGYADASAVKWNPYSKAVQCHNCGQTYTPLAQPEQEHWDAIPDAFNKWWDADYDDTGNPFRKNSPAYWAWAGWKAASKQPEQEPVAKVELMLTGGAAGLATRIVEIDDHLRERLRPGQLLYTAPPQRKKLPPQTPCLLTQAENKMFRFGWLECEAAHGIKGEA